MNRIHAEYRTRGIQATMKTNTMIALKNYHMKKIILNALISNSYDACYSFLRIHRLPHPYRPSPSTDNGSYRLTRVHHDNKHQWSIKGNNRLGFGFFLNFFWEIPLTTKVFSELTCFHGYMQHRFTYANWTTL